MTSRGIVVDLPNSPYHSIASGHIFFFSSEFYRNKFEQMLEQNRVEVSQRISDRYKVQAQFDFMADVYLYQKIEKRGFYIRGEEGEYKCREMLKFDGEKVTLKELPI